MGAAAACRLRPRPRRLVQPPLEFGAGFGLNRGSLRLRRVYGGHPSAAGPPLVWSKCGTGWSSFNGMFSASLGASNKTDVRALVGARSLEASHAPSMRANATRIAPASRTAKTARRPSSLAFARPLAMTCVAVLSAIVGGGHESSFLRVQECWVHSVCCHCLAASIVSMGRMVR